jgi:hypothetical protein
MHFIYLRQSEKKQRRLKKEKENSIDGFLFALSFIVIGIAVMTYIS